MARAHDTLAAVRAAKPDRPLLRTFVVSACYQFSAGPVIQFQTFDIGLEPARQLVLRNEHRPVGREGHEGQVIDMHFVMQHQRVVALAPVVADVFVTVDDQGVDVEILQPRGHRQSRLTPADHQHGGIAVGIRAALTQPVQPVLAAELPSAAIRLHLRRQGPRRLSVQCVQRSQQVPREQSMRVVRVGHQAQHPDARAMRGGEFDQGFDGLGSGAADPARRRAPSRKPKSPGLRARHGSRQRRFNRRTPIHRLQVPGKGEHIAPMAIGKEQRPGCLRVPMLQGVIKRLQPSCCRCRDVAVRILPERMGDLVHRVECGARLVMGWPAAGLRKAVSSCLCEIRAHFMKSVLAALQTRRRRGG